MIVRVVNILMRQSFNPSVTDNRIPTKIYSAMHDEKVCIDP